MNYYTGKIAMAKVQMTERIHLYNYGDECLDVTGGWTVTGTSIIKDVDHIRFTHSSLTGRLISMANQIEFNSSDRLFIRMLTEAPLGSYSFQVYKIGTSRFNNKISGGSGGVSQGHFTPGVLRVVEFFSPTSLEALISMVSNFGTWRIYEIWIDKYDI